MSVRRIRQNVPVRLGNVRIHERRLLDRLADLRRAIRAWAKRRDLWYDAGFHVPFVWNGDRPERGDVLYFYFEGPLYHLFNYASGPEYERRVAEFGRILEERGFWYDYLYHYMITILPSDDKSIDEYFALYRWQWLQHLAQKRLTDIHSEVFDYVEEHPEALARLSWRQYEEVLDSIFKNQGYYTELGPGTNDGGVDIRLYQNSAIPELVTVVQAKRYTSRPIGLDAVAALLGVAVEQRAERGILATTSRFQPKAQRFAKSTQSRIDLPSIELADAKRVSGWCADIAKVLDGYFLGNSTEPPPLVANAPSTELTGKVLVAHGGYEIIANFFGVVEVDFPHEVIVKEIASKRLDPYNSGYEVPAPAIPCAGKRFVAFKHTANDGSVSYWGNGQLYSLWDGTRQWFDHND